MTEIVVQEQLLECAICIERLDETCKMLPCQHTYCRTCLERMYEHEGSLNCPQCRKTVPNIDGDNPIDALPTNLILISLIEQLKINPPRPRNENDEMQAAITNSLEDFQKEKTADMLLKHNEQLQTRLAMENSKRDVFLKNAQDMSEEMNELFLSQKSHDEEIFRRENQNLLTEKEKLEVEVAILKSEQENPDYITDLIFWFEKNYVSWNQDLKREVQNVLKNLRRSKVTQCNDNIQRRLRTLLENLQMDTKLETPAKIVETRENVTPHLHDELSEDGDIVDIVNKKLQEVKDLLKKESCLEKVNPKAEKNYKYTRQAHQLSTRTPQQPHPVHHHPFQHYYPSSQHYYTPPLPPLMSNHYYDPNIRSPHYPSYFYPPSNYAPVSNFASVPVPLVKDFRSNHSRNAHRDSFRDKSNPIGYHLSSNDFKNLNKFTHHKAEGKNDLKKSLILPDVRDYSHFDKKMDELNLEKNINRKQTYDKKIDEKVYQLPTSSKGEVCEPLLMLPDVRYYDHKVYSKLTHSRPIDDWKNDTKSFGMGHHGEKKKSYDDSSYKSNTGKSYRGRGKNRYRNASKFTSNNDGCESDSSTNSVTSVSSKLSTSSTPAVFHQKKPNFSHKGRNNGSYNKDFQTIFSNEKPSRKKPAENKTDHLEKVIYPSKAEARKRNLNVKKPFETPLIFLGKTSEGDRKSEIVRCLADIYAFEEIFTECQLIRF